MNEQDIQNKVNEYFEQNSESLQEELLELQKSYVKRKLRESHDEWEKEMEKQDDEFFKKITEILKYPYK